MSGARRQFQRLGSAFARGPSRCTAVVRRGLQFFAIGHREDDPDRKIRLDPIHIPTIAEERWFVRPR